MPLYQFRDKNTGKVVEVLRTFEEYHVPPDVEEAVRSGMTEEEFIHAQFEKIISPGIRMAKSDSWGPGKGGWGR